MHCYFRIKLYLCGVLLHCIGTNIAGKKIHWMSLGDL